MTITADSYFAARIRYLLLQAVFLALICIGCSHSGKPTATGVIDAPQPVSPATQNAADPLPAQNPETAADTDMDTDSPPDDTFAEESVEWLDEFDETEVQAEPDVADPLSGFNRVMFHVNDTLYFALLKPVASAYRELFPSPVRTGVYNFFTNLGAPVRFINCLLQGKGEKADAELVRFTMNTTIGVLGFGNPAGKYPELALNDEDMGQTLGSYGLGQGFYLVLPIIGPTTLRDGTGMLGDRLLSPINYIVEPRDVQMALWGYDNVNTLSFRLGDYETLKEAAIDPYEAIRNAYIQNRKTKVAQ